MTDEAATITSQLTDFGAALLRARDRHGLTQDALGKIIGVDGSSIGHWERGHHRPTPPCYEALTRWSPSLKKHPLPDTNRQDKPPGWPGSHEGAAPAVQPATKAPPNRVKAKVKEVGEALHRAEDARAKRAADAIGRCAHCRLTLNDEGFCTNSKCKLSPSFDDKLTEKKRGKANEAQLPLPFPPVPSQHGSAAHRLLKKYSTFIGITTSHNVRRSLHEFLCEAEGHGITLREVIEIIGDVS